MQVVDYLAVFLRAKSALVKIVVCSEAFECGTHAEADYILCVQPPSSKDGEALQNLRNLVHEAFYCVLTKAVWHVIVSHLQQHRKYRHATGALFLFGSKCAALMTPDTL